MLNNRGLAINVKKCLYEGVIVPTELYTAEELGMRNVKRRKYNIFETKYLRNLFGVSRMDRDRNEEVRWRAGIERELGSRADQRVLKWFGNVERLGEYTVYGLKSVDGGDKREEGMG